MIFVKFLIQIIVASGIIYFVSGRLIGSSINFVRRVLSVVISVTLTSFVYWYSYLRHTDFLSESMMQTVTEVSTLIWIGSMLLISMLLYLVFELFDSSGIAGGERRNGQRSILLRLRSYWRQQKRLRQVLKIAVTNGVVQTIKYARQRENEKELAIALRTTLEQCGGIFIKFGQVLSTRKELFSPIFIDELERLQHSVRPLQPEQVTKILAYSLPKPVEEVFTTFHMEPLAAASIGQVHKARLKNSDEVVVKLLRPEVKGIMRDDLDILEEFANWLTSKSTWAESLGFRELAGGFADGLREEIHLDIEVRNTLQVTNALAKSDYKVRIPKVYTQYSDEDIIVMEYVRGKSVSEGAAEFRRLSIDPKQFAQTVLYSFFEQMLFSGIFHADPHPGNIYIDEKDGAPILLDFGAVGRLGATQQEGLKLFLMGIQQNDSSILYDGLMLLVENAAHAERSRMEQAIDQILLKISYVDRIPTEELIHSLFTVVRDFGLAFYPSVGLALRSLVTLDGTLRIIDAQFDIFTEAKDFSSSYMRAAFLKPFKEPMATKERVQEELSMLIPTLRKMPRRVDQLIQRVESGKIILHHDIFSDEHNARFITQLFSRFVLLLVGITFGIISVALLAISQFIHDSYAVYLNTAAYLGLFLCAILLVRLSIQALRSMKQ
ncbi:ABC1 kinase family protein [Lysinibacillus sphaericus]|uniref:Ubiquinone biosynthesis protein n=1 Tax=Lysinibacillus sphaericus OT4b.31 TaxID=1285586 RepID=R7ZB06_LYSSH|nr:AarF/UbiB family protein [Lysinibacillus sphaericus]EON71194.1 ubiquinone biosynthesis protein [Lysinibacillus sphaericus OT4b.31]